MHVDDNCVGCAFCMLVCKIDAVEVFGRAKIVEDRCVKCLKCVSYCPVSAIRVDA